MKLSVSFLLFLCFLLPPYVMGQSSAEIRKKEQELERLRTEIRLYEKKLQESTRKEKLTLENLDVLERQIELIRRLVADLRKQEEALTKEIIAAQNSINELERQLSLRKQNYANYIKSIYKHGRMYDLEIILSSRSFNQLAIRLEYLRRFSQQRQREMRRIEEKRNDLEQQHRLFEENLELQRRLLTEKT